MHRAISALTVAVAGTPTRGGRLENRKASLLVFGFKVLRDTQQSFVYTLKNITGRNNPLDGVSGII